MFDKLKATLAEVKEHWEPRLNKSMWLAGIGIFFNVLAICFGFFIVPTGPSVTTWINVACLLYFLISTPLFILRMTRLNKEIKELDKELEKIPAHERLLSVLARSIKP